IGRPYGGQRSPKRKQASKSADFTPSGRGCSQHRFRRRNVESQSGDPDSRAAPAAFRAFFAPALNLLRLGLCIINNTSYAPSVRAPLSSQSSAGSDRTNLLHLRCTELTGASRLSRRFLAPASCASI